MYQAMSGDELRQKGVLLIENVRDGFQKHEACLLKGKEHAMERFLEKCLAVSGEASYVDFYYHLLSAEEKIRFEAEAGQEGKRLLPLFERAAENKVYYPLDGGNLGFLAGITARALLFSTFYFTSPKALVWGNYNLEYPLFCEESRDLELYKNIAVQCGLEVV